MWLFGIIYIYNICFQPVKNSSWQSFYCMNLFSECVMFYWCTYNGSCHWGSISKLLVLICSKNARNNTFCWLKHSRLVFVIVRPRYCRYDMIIWGKVILPRTFFWLEQSRRFNEEHVPSQIWSFVLLVRCCLKISAAVMMIILLIITYIIVYPPQLQHYCNNSCAWLWCNIILMFQAIKSSVCQKCMVNIK